MSLPPATMASAIGDDDDLIDVVLVLVTTYSNNAIQIDMFIEKTLAYPPPVRRAMDVCQYKVHAREAKPRKGTPYDHSFFCPPNPIPSSPVESPLPPPASLPPAATIKHSPRGQAKRRAGPIKTPLK